MSLHEERHKTKITMKKMLIFAVAIATSILVLFSCEKETMELQQNATESPIDTTQKEDILLSKSVSTSGGKTIYELRPAWLGLFQHYCQRNAGPVSSSYPNAEGIMTSTDAQKACGPTSVMMAAACLSKNCVPARTYPVNGTKLQSIYNTVKSYVGSGSITLASLVWYVNNYESHLTASSIATTSRSATNQFIKDALQADKFVIVSVNGYLNDINVVNNPNLYVNSSSNPDLVSQGNVTSSSSGNARNYISDANESSTGPAGHIIVVLRLVIDNNTGSGVVEYIDPLAKPRPNGQSNKRYVSFTRLLNSMKLNGVNDSVYDAISIAMK